MGFLKAVVEFFQPSNSSQGDKPVKSKALAVRKSMRVHAVYDSAQTNRDNIKHWAASDGLSADSAASSGVRQTLRNRSRYEVANNSYARGIVLTLANDTVGTGPRLQLLTEDDEVNRQVELDFSQWASVVGLAEILRTMRMARAQDGEAFAILVTNPVLGHPVKLDLRLIEADQVTSPIGNLLDSDEVDGIRLDRYGNPTLYRVLNQHPGGNSYRFGDYEDIPAKNMIHLFRPERPGQHRGIPEITPALPLFAQLRRFTLAVLTAAETAAEFAGVMYTDAPPDGEAVETEALDPIEIDRGSMLTLPGGWKMSQIEPMQPATTYAEFKKEILNEIARCLNMPFNVAAGNSSGYNYSSGRLDHQTYYKSIRVDQMAFACQVLDRILSAWLWEYVALMGSRLSLPIFDDFLNPILPPHTWFWDGMEHVDPAKEASAQETRLRNNTTTLAHEYARQGKDWESELRQLAREKRLKQELGLDEPVAAPTKTPDKGESDEDDSSEDEQS